MLHWRICNVYDWLYFEKDRHNYNDVGNIAVIYGDSDVRTGCVGCNLASRDVALERLIRHPEWSHLSPLLELKSLYKELKKPKWRKRKVEPERLKDGSYGKNVQRMGPLTMEARAYGLEWVLDIQKRAQIDLINTEEVSRIHEMWTLDMWPRKWSSKDIDASEPIDALFLTPDGQIIKQALLV